MIDILSNVVHFISTQAALVILAFGGLFWLLVRVINSDNPIDWWQFISSKGSDGQDYADIDKLGKVVGIVASTIVVLIMTHHDKMDSALLAVYLGYCGAVAGYSAYLRAKRDRAKREKTKKEDK